MTRFVTWTVQVRPFEEQVEVDGRKFTNPLDLWNHLQDTANGLAHRAPLPSLFITGNNFGELARWFAQHPDVEYKVPPGGVAITRVPTASHQLTAGQCKESAEDLGL